MIQVVNEAGAVCIYVHKCKIEAAVYSYDQFYARFFVPLVFYFISHLLNLTIS